MAVPQQRDPGTDQREFAPVGARLARPCETWTSLSDHVVPAILALVGSAGLVEATCLEPSS
jgi:hypothetical protein